MDYPYHKITDRQIVINRAHLLPDATWVGGKDTPDDAVESWQETFSLEGPDGTYGLNRTYVDTARAEEEVDQLRNVGSGPRLILMMAPSKALPGWNSLKHTDTDNAKTTLADWKAISDDFVIFQFGKLIRELPFPEAT